MSFINKQESPRVIKTHLPLEFLPDDLEKKSKVIYIVRNPKDTCVSFHYFMKMVTQSGYSGSLKDMIRLFSEGKGFLSIVNIKNVSKYYISILFSSIWTMACTCGQFYKQKRCSCHSLRRIIKRKLILLTIFKRFK